ncbi:MAG TPA: cupredoxin family protein [Burkholderiales bacterium]|nr:cupredoxin family protein [Burkholderiales bacterium]
MKCSVFVVAVALSVLSMAVFAHGETVHSRKFSPAQLAEEKTFGKAGDPKKITRTITFRMSDEMRFDPSHITVKQGETIRFIARNNGKLMHEMVFGTVQELKAHADQMKKFPGMEHDEPYMTHVAPGKSGEIIWQFTKPGVFDFACLIAGHYDAGMTGQITVK